jgi:TPR repeat protein
MVNLGTMYLYGKGVKKDYQEAIRLFRKAADKGDSKAEYNLGIIYEDGMGVRKNRSEAVKWYRLAAGHGHEDAESRLRELKAK